MEVHSRDQGFALGEPVVTMMKRRFRLQGMSTPLQVIHYVHVDPAGKYEVNFNQERDHLRSAVAPKIPVSQQQQQTAATLIAAATNTAAIIMKNKKKKVNSRLEMCADGCSLMRVVAGSSCFADNRCPFHSC